MPSAGDRRRNRQTRAAGCGREGHLNSLGLPTLLANIPWSFIVVLSYLFSFARISDHDGDLIQGGMDCCETSDESCALVDLTDRSG